MLEHEFVHVHQMLLGDFESNNPSGSSFARLRRSFFRSIRDEYRAHLVQLVRWPSLWPSEVMALDDWCVLRGYHTALEGLVEALMSFDATSAEVCSFLDSLPRSLARGFARAQIASGHARWLVEAWPRHLMTAVGVVVTERPWCVGGRHAPALARLALKGHEGKSCAPGAGA